VTSEGPTLDSQIDPRFGRAAGFVVVDPATWEFQYVDNGASQAMSQGAGINAAEAIARAGATALLTGYVGPKAFAALQAAGIAVIQAMGDMTVRQAVEEFAAGRTTAASAPNR
jgi:predicted Fe-Mo cluster-binding NifX family protein